jgi:hypothetical protein
MGILDTLKKAADALTKTQASPPPNAAASAKAAFLVGSRAADTVNAQAVPPLNAAAAAKAASLIGSKAAPLELSNAEVKAIIEAKAKEKGKPSNWQVSIVDLMTALDMNSSLASRKELAAKLNYSGYDADGSAEKNMWLHAELLKALAKNGGKVPSNLL